MGNSQRLVANQIWKNQVDAFENKIQKMVEENLEEQVGLFVKKYLHKTEREKKKEYQASVKPTADRDNYKADKQCLECQGYGHFKSACPSARRKMVIQCYECKGYGHTKNECLSKLSEKSAITTLSDTDNDSDEDDNVQNHFVTHFGIVEMDDSEEEVENVDLTSEGQKAGENQIPAEHQGTDPDDSESDDDCDMATKDQMGMLVTSWVKTQDENKRLLVEKQVVVEKLQQAENELKDVKAKNANLESRLFEQMKQVKMLSKGTEDLDYLLTVGRTANDSSGLGYKGKESTELKFVKATGSSEDVDQLKPLQQKGEKHDQHQRQRAGRGWKTEKTQHYGPNWGHQVVCWYCRKKGHMRYQCLKLQSRVQTSWGQQQKKVLCTTQKSEKGIQKSTTKKQAISEVWRKPTFRKQPLRQSTSTSRPVVMTTGVVQNAGSKHRKLRTQHKSDSRRFVTVGGFDRNSWKQNVDCWFCGKHGHIKAECHNYLNRIKHVIKHNNVYWDNQTRNRFWVQRSDLYHHPHHVEDWQCCDRRTSYHMKGIQGYRQKSDTMSHKRMAVCCEVERKNQHWNSHGYGVRQTARVKRGKQRCDSLHNNLL